MKLQVPAVGEAFILFCDNLASSSRSVITVVLSLGSIVKFEAGML